MSQRIGLPVLLGAFFLCLWHDKSLHDIVAIFQTSLLSIETILVLIIVVLIMAQSSAMHKTGQLERIVDIFHQLTGSAKLAMASLPAFVGLLPMPGGAVFSAPMVQSCKTIEASPLQKAATNYWFRHIWEYWWPFYPGVIVAYTICDIELSTFILLLFPMTLVSIFVGWFFILRPLRSPANPLQKKISRPYKLFLKETSPVSIIVCSFCLLLLIILFAEQKCLIPGIPSKLLRHAASVIAISMGLCWTWLYNRMPLKSIRTTLINKKILQMLFIIAAVMIFQGCLRQTGCVKNMAAELQAWHFPLLLVVITLPFVSGIVTGVAVGFAGTSFPLIIELLRTSSLSETHILAYVFLAYVAGFLGIIFSPIHVCLLLTAEYFDTSVNLILKKLAPLGLAVASIAFLFHLLIKTL